MTFGITSTGFEPKGVQDVLTDIQTNQRTLMDPNMDYDPDQPLGQLNGIFASKLTEIWEALAVAYDAFDPNAAEGILLDNLCALTGTKRLAPTNSLVTCTVNLDAGFSLLTGSTANVNGQPTNTWEAQQGIGLAPGVAAINTSGVAANVPCVFASTQTGPVAAAAGTLTTITTPVSHWNSITNPLDAALGTNLETDTDLRVKRAEELSSAGAGTTDAIRAALLKVAGVIQAYVFENTDDITDIYGQPPHCIHAVIDDGPSASASNAAIAATLWAESGGGIKLYGSTVVVTPDSTDVLQPVAFDRANRRNIYFNVVLTTTAAFPASGVEDVKVAMTLVPQGLGAEVVALAYKAACLTVQGVIDVPLLQVDFTPSPTNTANLQVGPFDRAVSDTSRMVVDGI